MITIKKYPNRRLYDTSQSQYVNLDYVRQLVITHSNFEVVDSKTGADLTKSILVQIISEQETSEQQSLLTNTLLKQLICFYGGDMQGFVSQYLEQSLSTFTQQQESIKELMKTQMEATPFGAFSKIMEQNLKTWEQFTKPKDDNK